MASNNQIQSQAQVPLRPKYLWQHGSIPQSIESYGAAFSGEIDFFIDSGYPYQGPASRRFKQIKSKPTESGQTPSDEPLGEWALKNDRAPNSLTADLLAAAEALGGNTDLGGISCLGGADSSWLRMELLDGEVYVEVSLSEHPNTNRVRADQTTKLRGSRCYRVMLELLGFDQPPIKLPGEQAVPKIEDIAEEVSELLVAHAIRCKSRRVHSDQ